MHCKLAAHLQVALVPHSETQSSDMCAGGNLWILLRA